MSKAYVLLSGGVDSSACLAHAKDRYKTVTGITVHYGQRHAKEIASAARVAAALDCEHRVMDIRGTIGVGGLTDESLVIPHVSYDDLPHGVSPTYVPFRNGTLLAIITSQAAADPEAKAVYYGAHAEDAANSAYPDCSPQFFEAMKAAIQIGTYGKIILEAPFIESTKDEVVIAGERLGVPWSLTWSCYEGGEHHCGTCPTCRARRSAFERAGVIDPTRYVAEV